MRQLLDYIEQRQEEESGILAMVRQRREGTSMLGSSSRRTHS